MSQIKATIYKIDIDIADMDRGYYATHQQTLAQHSHDTDSRLMLRILGFARHACEDLQFGQGLFDEDAPDFFAEDLQGYTEVAGVVGTPKEDTIKRMAQKAKQAVLIIPPSEETNPEDFWKTLENKFSRTENLSVWTISLHELSQLTALLSRTMRFSITIQDSHAFFATESQTIDIHFIDLK